MQSIDDTEKGSSCWVFSIFSIIFISNSNYNAKIPLSSKGLWEDQIYILNLTDRKELRILKGHLTAGLVRQASGCYI